MYSLCMVNYSIQNEISNERVSIRIQGNFWWHISAITCQIMMSTCQIFMSSCQLSILTCQIIMSTCQKNIITTSI